MSQTTPEPAGVRPVIAPADPAQWEASHRLAYPLIVDGERLERVTMRAITTGELARLVMIDERESSVSLRARALSCGLHPDVFSALAAVDGVLIAEKLRPFLPAGLVSAEDEMADAATGSLPGEGD